MHLGRQRVAGRLEHAWPEQRVKIRNVFADEVMNFAVVALPPIGEFFAVTIAPLLRTGNIPNWRVKPHVPVVTRRIGDFETEVRSGSADIPIPQFIGKKVSLQVVRGLALQCSRGGHPIFEKRVQFFQLHEQVCGLFEHRGGAAERADGIDQIGRSVSVTAGTIVSRLVLPAALGTGATDESIGQKRFGFGIKELLDGFFGNQVLSPQCLPELAADGSVLVAVGAAVVIELDSKASEITLVRLAHLSDQVEFTASFLTCPDHDRGAVRIIGTDIQAAVTPEFLKPNPHIGLQVLDEMPDVNGAVSIGQRSGNE